MFITQFVSIKSLFKHASFPAFVLTVALCFEGALALTDILSKRKERALTARLEQLAQQQRAEVGLTVALPKIELSYRAARRCHLTIYRQYYLEGKEGIAKTAWALYPLFYLKASQDALFWTHYCGNKIVVSSIAAMRDAEELDFELAHALGHILLNQRNPSFETTAKLRRSDRAKADYLLMLAEGFSDWLAVKTLGKENGKAAFVERSRLESYRTVRELEFDLGPLLNSRYFNSSALSYGFVHKIVSKAGRAGLERIIRAPPQELAALLEPESYAIKH